MADETKTQAAGQNKRNVLRLVLFGVLALLVIALFYDRFVARPQLESAYEKITQKNVEINAMADAGPMTNVHVQEVIGFPPSKAGTYPEDERRFMETYTWRRGLPWMSYKLFAVYENETDKRFLFQYKYALPGKEQRKAIAPVDERPDAKAGGDEAAKGGGSRGKGKRPPEFAELDANGDGMLVIEELGGVPERFRDRLLQADVNGDGKITKEEFDNRPKGRKKPTEEPLIEERPAEEKPAQEKPAEEKPAEQKPVEEKPAEEKPTQDKPAREKPAEEKPVEQKAAEEKPVEEKPAEQKPTQDKPAEEKPAEEKPAEEKPAEEKPAEEKPAEEKPAEEKPAEEKPAEEKPAEQKPTQDKPAEEKPAEEKPVEQKPAEKEPAA